MKRYLVVFILLMGCWVLFTGTIGLDELVIGAGISVAVTFMAARFMFPRKEDLKVVNGSVSLLHYFITLAVEEIKAHFRMALLIIKGVEDDRFINIRRPTHYELANLLIYNGITLTPGTIVVKCGDDSAIVHIASRSLRKKVGKKYASALRW